METIAFIAVTGVFVALAFLLVFNYQDRKAEKAKKEKSPSD